VQLLLELADGLVDKGAGAVQGQMPGQDVAGGGDGDSGGNDDSADNETGAGSEPPPSSPPAKDMAGARAAPTSAARTSVADLVLPSTATDNDAASDTGRSRSWNTRGKRVAAMI